MITGKNIKNYIVENRKRVLLSNESDVVVQGKHSRFVRIRKGEQLSPAHFNEVGKISPKDFWGSCSFSGTGSLKPIEGMAHSDKCTSDIERKTITDMRRPFPESEGDLQETQIICVRLVETRWILTPLKL